MKTVTLAESERGLHAALDIDPGDVVARSAGDVPARLALADLCEEAGDMARARGHRWQALHGRWPARGVGPGSTPVWRWWDAAYSETNDSEDLPPEVFNLLTGGDDAGRPEVRRYYATRRAAEDDLALALETLAQRGEMS